MTPPVHPLLPLDAPAARVSQYGGQTIRAAQFAAQAEHLARALPDAAFVINLAENRHHFLLGWVAACLREQTTLLPSAKTDDVVARLRREYPDHHTLDDGGIARCIGDMPEVAQAPVTNWEVPAARVVAIAFTSGSTGEPQAHPKTWGSLVVNARAAATAVLGGTGRSIVSTVPPQHMYGLEASTLGALIAGCFLHDRKPFFPADVRDALAAMPAPRVLVTAPAHLQVLAESALELPAIDRVVSATAPLAVDLARRIEHRWGTQVVEIYGCTEAGVMATRRPSQSESWRPFAGGTFSDAADAAEYRAPQLGEPVPLQDVVELLPDGSFLLRGRATDMIKVGGKRASLQELTRQLLAVPGVEDAVVFLPDPDSRPAAAVVAPGVTAAVILSALRARLDGVVVPRPLVLVDRLPRNAVGKLPREMLLRLLGTART
jgi:acyl-coenzyme A synthetase/AMP-(fatty) acid ligase